MADITRETSAMAALAAAIETLEADEVSRVARWFAAYASSRGAISAQGRRGLSDQWRAVLEAMADGGGLDNDGIQRAATEAGYTVTRAQVRAQTHNYVKSGWIERSGDVFVITALGRQQLSDE